MQGKKKKKSGSGGIRTHATFVTGALNQRLRPLGHATLLTWVVYVLALQATAYTSLSELVRELGWTELRAQSILVSTLYLYALFTMSTPGTCHEPYVGK